MESQCLRKCCGYFPHPLDDRYRANPGSLRQTDTSVETRAKNCSKPFQEHYLTYYSEVILNCHPNFSTC